MSIPTLDKLVEDLIQQSYNLEVVGEAVAVEAREVRHAASKLSNIDERLRSEGTQYDNFAAAEAALEKLREVERTVRHQAETIRAQIGSI